MKKYILRDNDLSKICVVSIGLLAILFKLLLSYTQYATIYPPLAPLDDDLMTNAAMSIVNGEWLGTYTYLTISKHAFFAVWLAFLHIIGMPFLVGNMALWAFSSLCAVFSVRPVFKKNYQRLILFLGLLYNPAASAQYATRIYRDSIFPSLCLIFFAGVIGVGLSYKDKINTWLPYLVMYGISFGCIYLCREDGIWIIPFFIVAFLIITILLIYQKIFVIKKVLSMVTPFALSAIIICIYCYQNYTHYERFIVSDFTSSEFKSAYGAMTSLKQTKWDPMVAIPEDVRQNLYQNIESFAPVERILRDASIKNSFYNKTHEDYLSGSFYWALRKSLSELGIYENALTAKDYYANLASEIQKLVYEGTLVTTNGKTKLRESVTPPIKIEYVPDVIVETINGIKTVLLFEQCDPLAERAVGTEEEIKPVEIFINQKGATSLIPYTETPYLSPIRTLTHTFMRIIVLIYKVFIPLMTTVSVIWQIKVLISDLTEKRITDDSILNIIMLGAIGMAILRCAMIAFVEVSSFGIGTYVMYLSTVHPLIILYAFSGTIKTFES